MDKLLPWYIGPSDLVFITARTILSPRASSCCQQYRMLFNWSRLEFYTTASLFLILPCNTPKVKLSICTYRRAACSTMAWWQVYAVKGFFLNFYLIIFWIIIRIISGLSFHEYISKNYIMNYGKKILLCFFELCYQGSVFAYKIWTKLMVESIIIIIKK